MNKALLTSSGVSRSKPCRLKCRYIKGTIGKKQSVRNNREETIAKKQYDKQYDKHYA